ncbi:ABC transporter ATP-binding protein [Streptomyces anandii]|uniref:ABC transporter ATP-binding protein n=1 Tax=Streptomyces anandii TaxID=285454 RepID=A0ABW6HFX1_9ACTN
MLPYGKAYLREELDRKVSFEAYDEIYTTVNRFVTLARFEDPRFLDRLRLAQEAGMSAPSEAVTAAVGLIASSMTAIGFIISLSILSPVLVSAIILSMLPTALVEFSLSSQRAGILHEIAPLRRREFFYRDAISNGRTAKEIRLYGTGDFLRQRMLEDRQSSDSLQRRFARRRARFGGTLSLAGAILAGAALVWAVHGARSGTLTVGDVSMLIAAVAGVQHAVSELVETAATAHHSLLVFDHYMSVVDSAPDVAPPVASRPITALSHGIEIRDVWFRYSDEGPWVLRGVNLFIPHGRTVGLVGKNGAGKTTLVKLLCRFHDPTRGAIYWDGTDIRNIAPAELRRRIGAVFQDFTYYDLSAAENIGIGDVDRIADVPRIRRAATRAGVHDVISGLPYGYETLLTRVFFDQADKEDPRTGVQLSGGQWQRIALARGLMREERDFLILDEPTSGLDPEAESRVVSELTEHRAGRTSLLITHRLGSIRTSDSIAVLTAGQISEIGTHEELIASRGDYADLFFMQAEGYIGS